MTRERLEGEQGFTLVELLVASTAGIIVLITVGYVAMGALRESNRTTQRVEANQTARLVMHQITEDLHSACVAPQIAPVRPGSTGSSLSFVHQATSAVTPVPVLSTVSLSGSKLTQTRYANTGGTFPSWTFSPTPTSSRELSEGISQVSPSTPIFRYYAYSNGAISTTPLPVPLSTADAARTVQVTIAFDAAPLRIRVLDENSDTSIQDTVLMRFSSAAFATSAPNMPCQ